LYGGSAWLTAAKQISDVLVADILEAVHPAWHIASLAPIDMTMWIKDVCSRIVFLYHAAHWRNGTTSMAILWLWGMDKYLCTCTASVFQDAAVGHTILNLIVVIKHS
jgi:hypothetical protein